MKFRFFIVFSKIWLCLHWGGYLLGGEQGSNSQLMGKSWATNSGNVASLGANGHGDIGLSMMNLLGINRLCWVRYNYLFLCTCLRGWLCQRMFRSPVKPSCRWEIHEEYRKYGVPPISPGGPDDSSDHMT